MRNLLLLTLDPARLLRALGLDPDPWQRQLLLSNQRQVLLNCSRQSGKSTAVAVLALHTALFQPRSLILLLSPSLRQSLELFRKVLDCYRAVGAASRAAPTFAHAKRPAKNRTSPGPVRLAGPTHPFRPIIDNQTRIEFANQSRIVCLPGTEETIRSFSGVALLIIDEAARVPDDLYRSVRPMLAVSQGRLICLSTPFGQRGFFWEEWHSNSTDWHKIRIPWQDCQRITPSFIAQETRSLGDSWVRQEYACSFESLEGLVFPDFADFTSSELGMRNSEWKDNSTSPVPNSQFRTPNSILPNSAFRIPNLVGGLDFGYRNPFAAVWGRLDHDGVLWITGEHYQREKPLHDHIPHLPKKVTWYADPSGAQEIATLRRMGLVVRRGHNDIAAGLAALRSRIETGRLKVLGSACPNLLAEAKLYRYPTRQTGQPGSEIPVDDHNHALSALRYLVSRLDNSFFRQAKKQQVDGPTLVAGGEPTTAAITN